MARALPCVSPHSGAREELPQAYVVSDLSASHSAPPWYWAGTALVLGGHYPGFGWAPPRSWAGAALVQAGTALVLSGCCLALGRVDASSSCVVTA